jgi:O-antigen/teichoic acid export membrane protein
VALLALLVLAALVFGTASICLDQASIVLQRPASSAVRYSVGGTASLLAILGCLLVRETGGTTAGAVTIFACWAVTACVVCALGAWQLRRWIGYRYRPVFDVADSRSMLVVGLPNQVLTLTERAPQMLLPIFLAHLVSPEAVAYWYPAWMMAWVVYTAPLSVGLVQFAKTVRDPSELRRTTWSGLRWSLLLGGVLAVGLLVAAGPLLRVMGAEYANASADAVRILALGLLPYAVLQAYNALCRAREQLTEGIVTGLCTGSVAVAASLAVADRGATAMAIAWVAGVSCGAIWALVRLCRLSSRTQPVRSPEGDVD